MAVMVLAAGAAACAGQGSTPPASGGAAGSTELTVYAASSLTTAFEQLVPVHAQVAPTIRLTLSFDSSSALRTRIEHGAPADVFAAADTRSVDLLAGAGLTSGAPVVFAGAQLTIVVPAGDARLVAEPLDLARPGVRVVAAGPNVPLTDYAEQVLTNLASVEGYPADFATRVERNVVSREDNARAVIAKVELGEADAAIVYAPDVRAAEGVRAVDIPAEANVTATYAAVAIAASDRRAEAAAFRDWLAGPAAANVLRELGFEAP